MLSAFTPILCELGSRGEITKPSPYFPPFCRQAQSWHSFWHGILRQTMACARLFFVDLLGQSEWRVFSQVRTRDHDELPAVLTREQAVRLL